MKSTARFAPRRFFSTGKKSTPVLCNAWQIADKHRALLGPRTVIVSSNDNQSKEMSQRMWFEMQRVGIQSTFITMNTPYPVLNTLQESLSLFRRTGAKSVITIGNGAVSDYGKVIRACAETALSPSQLLKSKAPYVQRETVPMFCVRSSQSVVPFLSSLQVLHAEDDILVSAQGRAPEVVASDGSFAGMVPYQNDDISKVYILSYLVDSLFTLAFQHAVKTPDVDTKILKHVLFQHISQFDTDKSLIALLHPSKWTGLNDAEGSFSDAARIIAQFREYVLQATHLHPNLWPGLIELSSMLSALNPKQDSSLPYSYHATKTFSALIEKVIPSSSDYFRPRDLQMVSALQATMDCLVDVTTLGSHDALKEIVFKGDTAASSCRKKNPKIFGKPYNSDKEEALTAAGHLEKLLIALDTEVEQNGGTLPDSEYRRSALQSDVMVDVMEKILQ